MFPFARGENEKRDTHNTVSYVWTNIIGDSQSNTVYLQETRAILTW